MDTIECVFCQSEVVKVISFDNSERFPVCFHCAYIFEFGQENFEALLHYLQDLYLVKQEDETYKEVCRECGAIQDETTPLCQACGKEV